MKKLICIALALLCLAGCTAKVPEAPMVQHAQPTVSAAPVQTQPPQEEQSFARGAWEGSTYRSAFAGVTLTLPQGWTHEDALQLEARTQWSEDGGAQSVTDLAAQNAETRESIYLLYEYTELSAEDYATVIVRGLEDSEEFPCTVAQPEMRALCGQEYLCLSVRVEEYALEQLYFLRRQGEGLVSIVLTGEDAQALAAWFE